MLALHDSNKLDMILNQLVKVLQSVKMYATIPKGILWVVVAIVTL